MKQQTRRIRFVCVVVLLAVWLAGCTAASAVQHTLQGNALREQGDPDQALAEYDAAIALDPGLAEAYYNRALVYDWLGDDTRALPDADKAIELKADVAEFYRLRGRIHRILGDYANSLADFDKALELAPQFVSAYVGRGMTYGMMGEFERAIQDFDQALALDPTDAEAYYYRGLTYSELDDYEKAIADFDKALELDPQFVSAYVGRGTTYGMTGEFERALQDLNQALMLDPTIAEAYILRGITYAGLGDGEQAIMDLERYLALTPGRPDHPQIEAWIEEFQQQNAQLSGRPSVDLTQLQGRPLLHLALAEQDGTSPFVTAATLPDGQRVGTYTPLGAVWSPLGDQFAFMSRAGWTTALFVMNLAGEAQRVFASAWDEELIGWLPAWSPDGQQMAIIVAHYAQDADRPVHVVVVIDAADPARVSRHPIPEGVILVPFHLSPPNKFRWSPDGQKILIAWEQAVVLDIAQDRVVPIAEQPVVAEWAADSAGVYYFPITHWDQPQGRELGGFYLRRLETETPVELVDAQGLAALGIRGHPGLHYGLSVLSPSGTQLAWVGGGAMTDDEELRVRIAIHAITPGETLALDEPVQTLELNKQIVAFEWSSDGQRAAVLTLDQAGTVAVEVLDLTTLEWTTLTTLDQEQWTSIVGDGIEGIEWLGLSKHLSWTQ